MREGHGLEEVRTWLANYVAYFNPRPWSTVEGESVTGDGDDEDASSSSSHLPLAI
jgi:hypothetical protein